MQVYLICSREDQNLVPAITEAMIVENIGMWADAPLSDNVSLEHQLYQWMEDSDLIVAIWSETSIHSDFVQKEWEIALTTTRRIIAVRVGEISLPEIPDYVTQLAVGDHNEVPTELVSFVKSISRLKLFISYSRKDQKIAKQLVGLIHRSPHEAWIDEAGIDPGEGFPEKIIQSIDQSDCFLLLWSKRSKASRWVEQEWNYAYKQSKRILPVLIDKTPLPMALEKINAFTSLDDERLYRFLNIDKLSERGNILERVSSVIKKIFRGAA